MKKILVLVLVSLMLFSVIGCAGGNKETGTNKDSKVTVGIVQIVEHPSLNTIREACIEELAVKGYKEGDNLIIDYQNAQNDQTNLKTICQKFADNNYDLIIAIATPSAQAAAGETQTIPIVFAACTDPLGSGLVTDLNKPGANITGTSDAVSAEKIMELAKRITPDIKTIGALYTSSETNSIAVIENLKEYAAKNGLTVVEATVTNSSEVQQAASSLTGKADCIFSPIDNTVASAMPIVAQVANKAKTPVYVGADSMVKDGGLATFGINYVILGQETADMAAEILNGKNPGDIPVRTMTEMDIYLNQATADEIGITIPDDVLAEAKEVF
ncbi:MAG TPA: ABC transporter substrate-binding protein [Syntrophomonadaceae bacterium]|nr:ABC transporter substrate-binding protein [Syntrophomonadaceae bacterium]HPR93600.1 ABC transporter substrate-binding protein [Syntrophomonadaceae bacterium]